MARPRPARMCAPLALLACVASCQGSCRRPRPPSPVEAALALVPAEATVAFFVDFARLRETPAWAQLSELAKQRAGDLQWVGELTRRTGLDPFRQVRSLVLAFPENARALGRYAMVVRGEGFDEVRLVAYARDQAQKRGADLRSFRHGRRVLWTDTRDGASSGFFLDGGTFVVGAGGWAERMAEQADAPRAGGGERRADFVHLCERAAGGGRAIWGASIVPAETRRQLAAQPGLGSAASVSRMAVGVDAGAGLTVELEADLSNAADARALAARVVEAVQQAKRNPAVLMAGLGPYLEGVTARAQGPSFAARLSLSGAQVGDLADRLEGLLRLLGRPRP